MVWKRRRFSPMSDRRVESQRSLVCLQVLRPCVPRHRCSRDYRRFETKGIGCKKSKMHCYSMFPSRTFPFQRNPTPLKLDMTWINTLIACRTISSSAERKGPPNCHQSSFEPSKQSSHQSHNWIEPCLTLWTRCGKGSNSVPTMLYIECSRQSES